MLLYRRQKMFYRAEPDSANVQRGIRRQTCKYIFAVYITCLCFLLTGCFGTQDNGSAGTSVPETIQQNEAAEEPEVEAPATETPESEASEMLQEAPFIFTYDFSNKESKLPTSTAAKLPQWKGFNLLNLFTFGKTKSFNEDEFKMMSEWGFNFVRIPMDYRCWITPGDWNEIDERVLKQIDKAVEYGIQYDIHICLNFHRAPGYTVAQPPESTDLWTQEAPQEAFTRMWAMFAERYKNVPNEYLSFNLVNEPPFGIGEKAYVAVIKKAAEAIWAQDPDRLIIADGAENCKLPSYQLKDLGIAQAIRGYEPYSLTHYKASWANWLSDDLPAPTWPVMIIPSYLYGDGKRSWQSPYSIEYDFSEAYNVDVNVGIVSGSARLVAKADGREIYNHLFESGPGEGEWTQEVYRAEYDVYQNIFDKDYRIEIPAGTQVFTLEVTKGDWMTIKDMRFSSVSENGMGFSVTPTSDEWGAAIHPIKIDADGQMIMEGNENVWDGAYLRETRMKPWEELMQSGGGVMVGGWGSYTKTPHDVVLRWMEDNLKNFEEAGMGWALWNFNVDDGFGIINSNRSDVVYEDYNGYRLDREMLELLLKYVD